MPDYSVTIKKTKVGDPTLLFQFSLSNGESIPTLSLNFILTNNNNSVSKEIQFSLSDVPTETDILLIAPFLANERTDSIAMQVTFTSTNCTFTLGEGSIPGFTQTNPNSFYNPSIEVVPNSGLPPFTLPSPGTTTAVAIQCTDDESGDRALMVQQDKKITMLDQFDNLLQAQIGEIMGQSDGSYSISVGGTQIKIAGNSKYTIRASESNPNSYYVYSGETYMGGNTAEGQLYTQEGKAPSTSSNNYNMALKWFFYDLASLNE